MKLSPAEKLKRLKMILSGMGSAVLAYSGGADSTFLLKIARDVLGDKLLAVTASSETYPASEEKEAVRLARRYGVRHRIIRTCELKDPRFRENSPRRCYRCKTELFRKLKKISGKEGFG
ncbi:MAG TPA: TIGR00268 family protein, partial [bacterium]|nr:TIGR00268 family protein [bacterium]